jgi:hypothetical protein
MSATQCALYSTFAAKFNLNPRVYAMSYLVPAKSNIITVLIVQASIFIWTYPRCDWWFIDKSMRVILHICCQIQSGISGLRYNIFGPGQIQLNYIYWYPGFNIQLNVSQLQLVLYRQIDACYSPHLLPNIVHNIRLALCQIWSRSHPI